MEHLQELKDSPFPPTHSVLDCISIHPTPYNQHNSRTDDVVFFGGAVDMKHTMAPIPSSTACVTAVLQG